MKLETGIIYIAKNDYFGKDGPFSFVVLRKLSNKNVKIRWWRGNSPAIEYDTGMTEEHFNEYYGPIRKLTKLELALK